MFFRLLHLVPKNWISRLVGRIAESRLPFGLHTRLRDGFIRRFKVDVSEAEHPREDYPTLGAFFVRRLKPGARPLGGSPLVWPVDGTLTQRGRLESPDLLLNQVKGIRYSLNALLSGWDASPYAGGAFMTVYLAPWDYHRIHAPASGRVARARHVAGCLWPVNRWSVDNIPDLFVRNDRMLVEMDCPGGRLALVLIGATNVGRTRLAFTGLRGNPPSPEGLRDFVPAAAPQLGKGDELARFEMGSTVVLLLDAAWSSRLRPEILAGDASVPVPAPVRLGADMAV